MTITTIVGARPQFVKAAMVSRALCSCGVHEVMIHTGQHYDENMSDVFFRNLEIPSPQINLGIGSGTHGEHTGRMLLAIEGALIESRPKMVIVYGDTNSTLAGALAAVKLHIPVAHVEAGLRSFDRRMPEEINRILTDHASDWLFAPTTTAVANLRAEGIAEGKVFCVGDVMYDAALYYGAKAERESSILADLELQPRQFVLATIHRAENTDDSRRLESVFLGLASAAKDAPVVLPLHPRTEAALTSRGIFTRVAKSIRVIPPLGYLDMMMLEKNARLVVTDSGGVQKEAFFYQVPCITVRSQTEWTELVELGWNQLVPPASSRHIARAVRSALDWTPPSCLNPFGDGTSASQITKALCGWIDQDGSGASSSGRLLASRLLA